MRIEFKKRLEERVSKTEKVFSFTGVIAGAATALYGSYEVCNEINDHFDLSSFGMVTLDAVVIGSAIVILGIGGGVAGKLVGMTLGTVYHYTAEFNDQINHSVRSTVNKISRYQRDKEFRNREKSSFKLNLYKGIKYPTKR